MIAARLLLWFMQAALAPQAELVLENLTLRQQLHVLQRSGKRPRLTPTDRAFWAVLSRVWSNWHASLMIVQSATVVG